MPHREIKATMMEALEPVNVPAMDRPSVILAWFMDNIRFDVDPDPEGVVTMECTVCGESICEVCFIISVWGPGGIACGGMPWGAIQAVVPSNPITKF